MMGFAALYPSYEFYPCYEFYPSYELYLSYEFNPSCEPRSRARSINASTNGGVIGNRVIRTP
jgi:hypothetical protein